MTERLRTGVLGATGLAGQQVLAALERHPWFTVTAVGASEKSTGKSLGDALRDESGASRWFAEGRPDASLLSLPCLNDAQLLAQRSRTNGSRALLSGFRSSARPRRFAMSPTFRS